MTVTQSQLDAYVHVLSDNSYTGACLLDLLQEIANGEWAAAISYCDEDNDPMEDFNYRGSTWHY